jgi:hypothetical protein
MNKRSCLGKVRYLNEVFYFLNNKKEINSKEMKVNWATTSGGNVTGHQPKLDSSSMLSKSKD